MKRSIVCCCVLGVLLGTLPAAVAGPLQFSVNSLPDVQWWASARKSTLAANPDGTGDVVSGGPVGFMSDLSGSGHHAVMGSSLLAGGDAFRPTYQANFQRGMPALAFDGINDFSSLGGDLINGASAATIAFAIQGNDVSVANRRIWGASDGINAAGLSFNSLAHPVVISALRNGGFAAATDTSGYAFDSPTNGDYSMIIVGRVRPGGLTDIWENGVLRGSQSSPAGANNLIRSLQTKLLGAANGASNSADLTPLAGSFTSFRFLEGFVSTSAISDAQVGQVYDYMSAQWPGVQNVKGSPNLYWNAAVNGDRAVQTINAGHLQGIAVGDGGRYIFHSDMIEKYDAAWHLQTNNQAVFAGVPTTYGTPQHIGDGDYYGGKIYAPLEIDFGGTGKFIGVYDATSPGLPLLGVRDITAQHQEVSSIVVVPEHGAHGVMYVSSFFAGVGGDKLSMYDFQGGNVDSPDFGQFLGSLTIPATITDIQGLEWKDGYFYFSASGAGGNRIERVALTGSGLALTSQVVVRGHTTVQGLALDGDLAYQAFQSGSTSEYIDVLKNLDADIVTPLFGRIAGDANGDNRVDFSDLSILLVHYNQPGTFAWGDFDNSGTVDFSDLSLLLLHYNQTASLAASAAVPEPTPLAIAAVALAVVFLRWFTIRRSVRFAQASVVRVNSSASHLVRSAARAAIFVGLLLISFESAPAAAIPINLLPLGDSNTAANRGYYVVPLLNLLTANNYATNFIANEGHSGYIIDGSMAGAPRTGLRENIGVGHVPDFLDHAHVNEPNTYILLMIGTNDVDTGYQLSTTQVQSRMTGLLAAIQAEAPLAHVVVATLPPIIGTEVAVQKFNADIAPTAVGPRVSLVDMYGVFQPDPTPYMEDRLHPNRTAGNIMAPVWLEAIQVGARLPGDANGDNRVDFADLSSLLLHYNQPGTFAVGDFNRSSFVDFSDLSLLLLNYNKSAASPLLATVVPEPSTLLLGCLAACVLGIRRRFR